MKKGFWTRPIRETLKDREGGSVVADKMDRAADTVERQHAAMQATHDRVANHMQEGGPERKYRRKHHVPDGVMIAVGVGGVEFDGEFVTIRRTTRMVTGKSEKRIHVSRISSIQITPPGLMTRGFIEFTFPGSNERTNTSLSGCAASWRRRGRCWRPAADRSPGGLYPAADSALGSRDPKAGRAARYWNIGAAPIVASSPTSGKM